MNKIKLLQVCLLFSVFHLNCAERAKPELGPLFVKQDDGSWKKVFFPSSIF